MPQRPLQGAAISGSQPIEATLEEVEQRAMLHALERFQNTRRHRWRQGQCDKSRDEDRTDHRHGEFDEQAACRALLKRERREDGHE